MRWRVGLRAVLVASFLTVGCARDGNRPTASPETAATVLLPEPETTGGIAAAADQLEADASLVTRFRQISAPLLTLSTVSNDSERRSICRGIAERLGAEVPPDALLDAALDISDPILSELAVSDRTARSDLLVACLEGNRSMTSSGLQQVKAIDVLFTRRLEQR